MGICITATMLFNKNLYSWRVAYVLNHLQQPSTRLLPPDENLFVSSTKKIYKISKFAVPKDWCVRPKNTLYYG